MLSSICIKLNAGRLGQPWRERVERQTEYRHRQLINLLRQLTGNRPIYGEDDKPYLPPIYVTEQEIQAKYDRQQRRKMLGEFVEQHDKDIKRAN